MKPQNVDMWRQQIQERFIAHKERNPQDFERKIDLSWSNWGFGLEDLRVSAQRLADNGLEFIELHGNHYGPTIGYDVEATRAILTEAGLRVSGVCGMFSDDNDLSSNRPIKQQEAVDYIKREVAFTAEMGGHYLLVVPASCGRAEALDAYEFERSWRMLREVADVFVEYGVKAAIEPIRSAEVSIVHTVAEAKRYIEAVNHPGIQHINGDVYHMQVEEVYIPQAILDAGERLVNLHLADSNRLALGAGSMDLDTVIMASYLVGMNREGRFLTPEPLGPGSAPYPARNGLADAHKLDMLVHDSVAYFREREEAVRALS
ncbi:sugar phosphate isomerase/epimerase family protein [Trueperella sp. LYQ143]|uniref:sugar phosphate isomerase/epimerase family protein n=1 Tax=unclassified Trueperella TaxID=2630174 RepID=UPI0039838B83